MFSLTPRSIFGLIAVASVIVVFIYIKSILNKNEELTKDLVNKEQEVVLLKSSIELQNKKLKELEALNTNVAKEYTSIERKYNDLRSKSIDIEKYSVDNNISKNESSLILEKQRVRKGLDAFFNR